MFGMRSPELVGVFQQTKPFIRCCYVDEKIIPDDIHASLLNRDIRKCHWVSLLSQRVYIRINAVDEVDRLVDSNLAYLNSSDNMNGSRSQFYCQSNQAIKYIIRIFKSHCSDLDGDDLLFKDEYSNDFFYDDGLLLCPIPVPINVHPKNAQVFFIHFLLTHGKYTFLPNSMRKTDIFITLVQPMFDDIIIRNEFSANEHPHTIPGLQLSLTDEFRQFWIDNRRKQLQSIFKDYHNLEGIPVREQVENVTRSGFINWDPTNIPQYAEQSVEPFEEQVFALKVLKSTIDKYLDSTSMTYTKGVIVHGGPGTGKTHIAKLAVLHALSKGLNIISTSILSVRASYLGDTHLHSLFCWTPQNCV